MRVRLVVVALLILAPMSWVGAQEARTVPQEVLDRIVDDDPNPLPRFLAPEEYGLPIPAPEAFLAPPTGDASVREAVRISMMYATAVAEKPRPVSLPRKSGAMMKAPI